MNRLTIKEVNEQIESLTINTNEQLENANFLAKECNRLIKEVKASHKEAITLYHRLHKEAKEKEKEALMPLENAKRILKEAIGEYMKEVEQLKVAQQEDNGIITKEKALKGTHVRKKWKARIVDESKVPTSYKNHTIRPVDLKMLNDIAKYEEGQAIIGGVEFFQEESVVIR